MSKISFKTNSAVNTLTSWLVNKLEVTPHCFDKPSAFARATDSGSGESSDSEGSVHSTHSRTPFLRKPPNKAHLKMSNPFQLSPSDVLSQTSTRKNNPVPRTSQFSDDMLNPPEVQRIVVEHVIKNDTNATQGQLEWLRTFSGKIPKPPSESDFENWCLHVQLMFQDCPSVDVQRRKILESLLTPASDVVKQLGSCAHPRDYVKLLNSAYGVVEDGDEMFGSTGRTNC